MNGCTRMVHARRTPIGLPSCRAFGVLIGLQAEANAAIVPHRTSPVLRVSVAVLLNSCFARNKRLLCPRRGAGLALLALLALLLAAALFGSAVAHAFDAQRLALAAQALGPRAVAAVGPLQQLIAQGARATDDSRVRATNQFFNDAIQFVDDIRGLGHVRLLGFAAAGARQGNG